MRTHRIVIFVCLMISLFISCNRKYEKDELDPTMHLAGSNRVELERVLNHYESDSLKRKPAYNPHQKPSLQEMFRRKGLCRAVGRICKLFVNSYIKAFQILDVIL